MKKLTHPPASAITVEGILHALADPIRAQIFVEIAKADCPKTCSTFLEVSEKSVPKSTLSQHFKVLREAGLIRSERKGVEMYNTSRCEDLDERFSVLISAIIAAYTRQYQQGRLAENAVSPQPKNSVEL